MPFRPGTTWGSIYNAAKSPWTQQGSNGQHMEMTGLIEPDNPFDNNLKAMQANALQQQTAQSQQKFDLLQSFLKGFKPGGAGSLNFSSNSPNLPAPNYLTPSPVYGQSQIDAMSGLQRSNLLGQAANSTRQFTSGLANRGFSPLSPMGNFMGQSNLMKAHAGAASNETNLNFNAAKANSDAQLQAQGINAGLYGNYIGALGQQRNIDAELAMKQLGMQYDTYNTILRGIL